MEYYLKNIRPWLHVVALFTVGFMMIFDPHLMDSVDPSGRKAGIKLIFSYIWSIPTGIIIVLIASFLGYRQLKKNSKKD